MEKGRVCVIIQAKGLIKIVVKFSPQKILCKFVSCTRQLFWGAKNNVHEEDFVAVILYKKSKFKVYISLKGNKLACFAK